MESAKAVLDLIAYVHQMIKRIFDAFENFGKTYDARSLEAFVEAQAKAFGAVLFETALRLKMASQPRPKSLPCPCGRRQHFVGTRPRSLITVMGAIDVSERHYFQCDQCKKVGYSGDMLRGATDFSQLAEERLAMTGKEMAFQKAAHHLERMGLFKISASTIRDVCARTGQAVREQIDHDAARQHTPQPAKAEEQCARLAIAVDGVMLGRIDPQHRRRKSRKTGRKVRNKTRLKHFFQEVKTLVVFDFNMQGEAGRKTFHATQERVEEFREKVTAEALKRGADKAQELVFLGDGAAWIWKTATGRFPHATQILDWYHAVEHLWQTGRAYFGCREKELWAWAKTQEQFLWTGNVASVIDALKKVSTALGAPDENLSETARAGDARWIAHRNAGYFERNQARMDYPRYRDAGLPIGSGVVESGCKHVVADRLKRTGMRWDESGAEHILALRCHDLNQRWDSIWSTKVS
jgi:hypothetical protein